MKKMMVAAAVVLVAMGSGGPSWAADEPVISGKVVKKRPSAPATGETAGQVQFEEGEVRSIRRLMGRNVQGTHGDRLGEVSEILLDTSRGEIAYLVVTEEAPGLGDERRIIPWRAVFTHPQTASLTANIDADRFRKAPEATEVADRQQAEEIHRFYGVAPYWQEELREPAPAILPSEPEPAPARPPQQQPQKPAPEAGETPLWFE